MAIDAHPQPTPPSQSMFLSKDQVLEMLQDDLRATGLIPKRRRGNANGRSICQSQLIPLHVTQLQSSVFADPQRFPDDAAQFDSAYWLREDEVVWSEQGTVCCDIATA